MTEFNSKRRNASFTALAMAAGGAMAPPSADICFPAT